MGGGWFKGREYGHAPQTESDLTVVWLPDGCYRNGELQPDARTVSYPVWQGIQDALNKLYELLDDVPNPRMVRAAQRLSVHGDVTIVGDVPSPATEGHASGDGQTVTAEDVKA